MYPNYTTPIDWHCSESRAVCIPHPSAALGTEHQQRTAIAAFLDDPDPDRERAWRRARRQCVPHAADQTWRQQ